MKDKTVFPGDFLSLGEEYLPGKNAFEHQNGNIYSSVVGKANFDDDHKVVNVNNSVKQSKLIDVGSIVFAKVSRVKENSVFLDIIKAENNEETRKIGSALAFLPVFNAKNSFVKFLSDLFKVGDIIKAKVDLVTPFSIELETKSSSAFGVVKGFCAHCRAQVRMLNNGFKCQKCAMSAERKFSSDYLLK